MIQRNNSFDFLRFVFAFTVVMGHICVIVGVPALEKLIPYFDTYIPVTGFFVISGFLISQSYIRSKNLKDYFLKRAKRLLPAYLFVVLACAFGLVFFSSYSSEEYFSNTLFYKYLAANLSFLNFLQPCLPGVFENGNPDCAVNGALWTIKVEVMFYFTLPLLFWVYRRAKHQIAFLVLIYILSILYRNGLRWMAVINDDGVYGILARQLPGFLSYFVSGMGLFLYFDKIKLRIKKWVIPAILVFGIEYYLNLEILRPLALAILVFYVAYSFKPLNDFGKYGDISYGIYIFHYPIIMLACYLGLYNHFSLINSTIFLIVIILSVGFASWHLLEKRFLRR